MSASALPLPRATTIVLRGVQDFGNTDALRKQLEIAERMERVTIDLNDVRFLDASALGSLVHLYNVMRTVSPHPVVRLVGLRPHVASLFRLTNLDSLFELIETESVAHAVA